MTDSVLLELADSHTPDDWHSALRTYWPHATDLARNAALEALAEHRGAQQAVKRGDRYAHREFNRAVGRLVAAEQLLSVRSLERSAGRSER